MQARHPQRGSEEGECLILRTPKQEAPCVLGRGFPHLGASDASEQETGWSMQPSPPQQQQRKFHTVPPPALHRPRHPYTIRSSHPPHRHDHRHPYRAMTVTALQELTLPFTDAPVASSSDSHRRLLYHLSPT